MQDFKKALAICAAVSVFTSGALVGLQGVSGILDSQVSTSLVKRGLADDSTSATVSDAVTTRIKKTLSQVLK